MHFWKSFEWRSLWTSCFFSQRSWGDFLLPLVTSASLETPFQFDVYFYFSPPGKNSCLVTSSNEVLCFFSWLGCFFPVTWVNILSNMLILIVVMETTRTNHKNFRVVLHWNSFMPQQNDNHPRMIIILLWHIAVSMQDHLKIFMVCSGRFHDNKQD